MRFRFPASCYKASEVAEGINELDLVIVIPYLTSLGVIDSLGLRFYNAYLKVDSARQLD